MAKVYGPPTLIERPNFDDFFEGSKYDMEGHTKAVDEYIKKLSAEAKKGGDHDLLGEMITFPVADGEAIYIVWKIKPLTLIHVPVYDGYQIPDAHMRGLNLADIRKNVEARRWWQEATKGRKK